MNQPVPLVDLRAQMAEILEVVSPKIDQILRSAAFIGGPEVADFEHAYAAYVGARHCVGVGNGTDAVELALRAIGIGAGDEVLVPANTFVATAEAVARTGARSVFVDVDDDALLMAPEAVKSAATARTRAVIPVHLYGQTAPVDEIAAAVAHVEARVVEDAAQSQGARRHGVGSGVLGDIAATSFYPGKNLGAAGDAGAVTTDDDDLADHVRSLSNHGSPVKYVHEIVGFNSRLDALQAVVLRAKLDRLEVWNEARRAAANRYGEMLAGLEGVRLPAVLPGNLPVWHLYVVRVAERDRVLERLQRDGIGAGLHYPVPVHLTPAFGDGHRAGEFPIAEAAADQILSLPMHPHLTVADQERVVDSLRRALVG
ncbi:DegT/DnrJ/EryC1/StrS family aminotransferase [Cellulomonas sp. P5_E12]